MGERPFRVGAQPYDGEAMRARADELLADEAVENKRGVYEYLLGGEEDVRLLNVRLFDKRMADKAYKRQTAAAKEAGVSNCPDCAASDTSRARRFTLGRIWTPTT